MHPGVGQLVRAGSAVLYLCHYFGMSNVVMCAGGLLALCLCGYSSAIATVLGAAPVSPGAVPTVAHGEARSDEQSSRSTWATWLGSYNPFISTTACMGSTALLFKCASMIETGARATWSFGGDRFPRDLVELSTLLRVFAVAAAGWQGFRIIKSYASDPRSVADSAGRTSEGAGVAEPAAVAVAAAKAVLGGNTQAHAEREEEDEALLRNSRWVGLGIAALGGGMATTLLMRTGEEKIFNDVLKNARLNVAASLMGGAALGTAVRVVQHYV